MPRPIISIDEEKCDGCGQCILDCAEGALAIENGKAKLISEVYCDGLGACLNCPKGALKLSMRDAPPFDEAAALAAKKQREKASAKAAPGLRPLSPLRGNNQYSRAVLPSWPIQLELAPANAAFLKNAPLLLAAHCAGFALADIHDKIKNHIPLIACPKLENREILADKLAAIISANDIPSIDILRMSVPCCALPEIAEMACKKAGRKPETTIQIAQLS